MSVVWRCRKEDLDPQFAADVDKLLADSPFSWYVIWGKRSLLIQRVLYEKYLAGGPKAAPPGKSAHNFGLAVDVVLDDPSKPGLQMLWNNKLAGWVWLIAAVARHPRLHSLWKIGDYDHIERYRWHDHIQKETVLPDPQLALALG